MDKKKVVIGLSGGVDSALAAYILKNVDNYEVVAVFMRNWDSLLNNDIKGNKAMSEVVEEQICEQEQDYEDAKEVAKFLGIELIRIDFIKEYWDEVFSKSLEYYKKGLTPNPDIWCNKYIKFETFYDYAINKLGADFLAMGHYAGIKTVKGKTFLTTAVDKVKDQTYFLSQIKKEYLSKLLFPLQNMEKDEVRKMAHEVKLPNADRKESMGICFIGERSFKKFLENYLDVVKGKVIDIKTKKVVGEHDGAHFYTIGQRRGLNLGGNETAYYVVDKDQATNIVYVDQGDDDSLLYKTHASLIEMNLLVDKLPAKARAKVRHSPNSYRVEIVKLDDNSYEIAFLDKVRALTPGQSCVFYKDDICLGGGIINKVW